MVHYTYAIKEVDSVKTVIFEGDIDHEGSPELETLLNSLINSDTEKLAADFTNIDFLPSICFGVLLASGEMAKERGVELIVKMRPHHAALARGIGMEQIITVITN